MKEALIKDKHKYTILKEGSISSPKGFKAGGLHCGIRRKKLDLGWIYSEVPANSAGVYTTNLFQAAPLTVTRESLAVENKIQAILVNSGNANACTGEQGMKNALEMRNHFSTSLGIPEYYVAVTSTGVIGEQLPIDKINNGIKQINVMDNQIGHFEQAILTTDLTVKHLAVSVEIDGKEVIIGGAAKGSGMIHPNMATMLGFVTTDALIAPDTLHAALKEITNQSFNMITVDGDTSTNDMVLILANGLAANNELSPNHPDWDTFMLGLEKVCEELAKKIARDGEGATKLIEVEVQGAAELETAQVISKTIVGSSLVKTAIFGSDANWGRIVCAVGYSGKMIDPLKVTVKIGQITVVENGMPQPFDEDQAKIYLQNEHIKIVVDLNEGSENAIAWGCDLTYDYVRINASYRT
ncbi:bifunctional ornithine acetyltransferase/N-acetylglutamate synthase [Paenisporosarcina sp. TG20]|uniref:bifunctional ornithine acetyltransferase/N-acetylglutamate synthase n=1 Tax=Paenisporosarcina sp. TG20 TaxID=1211706 RepID=UPI0002FD1889|nr:bifunctional ornithine acetyltransferase/N-acetylglutamate synthase [Paenisporosarcina sp. TG20]